MTFNYWIFLDLYIVYFMYLCFQHCYLWRQSVSGGQLVSFTTFPLSVNHIWWCCNQDGFYWSRVYSFISHVWNDPVSETFKKLKNWPQKYGYAIFFSTVNDCPQYPRELVNLYFRYNKVRDSKIFGWPVFQFSQSSNHVNCMALNLGTEWMTS